jgi:hypothetical protein
VLQGVSFNRTLKNTCDPGMDTVASRGIPVVESPIEQPG